MDTDPSLSYWTAGRGNADRMPSYCSKFNVLGVSSFHVSSGSSQKTQVFFSFFEDIYRNFQSFSIVRVSLL